jgi:hypothetical protein
LRLNLADLALMRRLARLDVGTATLGALTHHDARMFLTLPCIVQGYAPFREVPRS